MVFLVRFAHIPSHLTGVFLEGSDTYNDLKVVYNGLAKAKAGIEITQTVTSPAQLRSVANDGARSQRDGVRKETK